MHLISNLPLIRTIATTAWFVISDIGFLLLRRVGMAILCVSGAFGWPGGSWLTESSEDPTARPAVGQDRQSPAMVYSILIQTR